MNDSKTNSCGMAHKEQQWFETKILNNNLRQQ